MTTKSFREDAYDLRYLQSAEYQPVGIENDPGISEIPASPDHQHQAFDDGTSIEQYSQGFPSLDPDNPVKLYRAGNHCVIDGVIDYTNESFTNPEIIYRWTLTQEPLWVPGFTISSQCAVFEENDLGVITYFSVTMQAIVFSTEVRINAISPTGADGSPDLVRLYINGFSFRTDSLATSEIYPPDGFSPFTWDGGPGTGWDVGVWA